MKLPDNIKRFSIDRLSKKERCLFYAVIALGCIFLFERFISGNIIAELKILNKKIVMQQIVNQKAKALIKNKQAIIKQASMYANYLSAEPGAGRDSLSRILTILEIIARKNNITLSDIKPNQLIRQAPGYSIYDVGITFQGSLKLVTHFIADLQDSDVIFDIQKVNIKTLEDSLQMKLELSAIIFK